MDCLLFSWDMKNIAYPAGYQGLKKMGTVPHSMTHYNFAAISLDKAKLYAIKE